VGWDRLDAVWPSQESGVAYILDRVWDGCQGRCASGEHGRIVIFQCFLTEYVRGRLEKNEQRVKTVGAGQDDEQAPELDERLFTLSQGNHLPRRKSPSTTSQL
jgi:hypothetical protein